MMVQYIDANIRQQSSLSWNWFRKHQSQLLVCGNMVIQTKHQNRAIRTLLFHVLHWWHKIQVRHLMKADVHPQLHYTENPRGPCTETALNMWRTPNCVARYKTYLRLFIHLLAISCSLIYHLITFPTGYVYLSVNSNSPSYNVLPSYAHKG